PNPIKVLMQTPLPSLSQQRRRTYNVCEDEVKYTFKLLNRYVFNEELPTPRFLLKQSRKHWGQCHGEVDPVNDQSFCIIEINRKFYCVQWFITILAHEMAHQYQWDVLGTYREQQGLPLLLSHGPSFFLFRDRLAEYGIPLKTDYSTGRWAKYQDLFKM
ncbi:MAG: SprT-like domain-containing protein, partial [Fischerella sp.]|nr:SprT-like domain-containing protein [Fischerella sp.]